jgi:uncharacterized membrane protein
MKLTDSGHPFYKPLWRRLLIVAIVALWAAYETLVSGESLWITLSTGMLVYAVWVFLIGWKRDENTGK